MLSDLLFLEKKLLGRSRWIWLTALVFTLVGLWSVRTGIQQYAFYKTGADSLLVANQKNYSQVKAELDTLKADTVQRAAIETPFTLDWKLKYMISRPVNPLSVLTTGQNDVSVLHKSARMNQPVFSNDFDEFKNPLQLMAGPFDFTFFLLFLYPLWFMALTYPVNSYEKEQGIWPWWQMTGRVVPKIVLRLIIRWFVSLAVLLPPLAYAFNYLSLQANFSYDAFACWILLAVCYTMFWLFITAVVVVIKKTGMQHVLALLGSWLLLLIMVPGLVNTLLYQSNPDSTRLDVATFRDVPEEAWNLPDSVHKRIFMMRYAQKIDTGRLPEPVIMQTYTYLKNTFEAEKHLQDTFMREAEQRSRNTARSFWVNPTGAWMRGFSQLAHSTQLHQLQFEHKLYKLGEQRFLYMYDNLVLEKNFTSAHLENLPVWEP